MGKDCNMGSSSSDAMSNHFVRPQLVGANSKEAQRTSVASTTPTNALLIESATDSRSNEKCTAAIAQCWRGGLSWRQNPFTKHGSSRIFQDIESLVCSILLNGDEQRVNTGSTFPQRGKKVFFRQLESALQLTSVSFFLGWRQKRRGSRSERKIGGANERIAALD